MPATRSSRKYAENRTRLRRGKSGHHNGCLTDQGAARPRRSASARRCGADRLTERLEERRFVERVAAALEGLVRTRHVPALVIAAPPRTLADLRRAFHDDVEARIVAEVGKDLTKHPVAEIETPPARVRMSSATAKRQLNVTYSSARSSSIFRPEFDRSSLGRGSTTIIPNPPGGAWQDFNVPRETRRGMQLTCGVKKVTGCRPAVSSGTSLEPDRRLGVKWGSAASATSFAGKPRRSP